MPRRKISNKDGRFNLQFGPYHPPRVRGGEELFCTIKGSVTVKRFSDGPIPWPLCYPGKRGSGKGGIGAYVLCGDLVRAVRHESNAAVCVAWGVTISTVSRWRRILGVKRNNMGTRGVFIKYVGKNVLTPLAKANSRAARTPEGDAEMGRQRRQDGRCFTRAWTPEEDALFATFSNAEIRRRLGCSQATAIKRRRELGIPLARGLSKFTNGRVFLWPSPAKLQARRLELGLFQTQVGKRCGWKHEGLYARLETGAQEKATPKVLAKIAKALECEVKDLLARR